MHSPRDGSFDVLFAVQDIEVIGQRATVVQETGAAKASNGWMWIRDGEKRGQGG